MSETISFDLEEIFECCACKDDERVKAPFTRAPKNGYYQKHPPIGQGPELFFVNIYFVIGQCSVLNGIILNTPCNEREGDVKETQQGDYYCECNN